MGETTAGELKAERMRLLGPEFGAVYHALWKEVVQLRWEWKQYRALFVDERVDLLNEHAPEFFWLVQHVLGDHVVSSIANLTDDRETGPGRANLTVRRLPSLANLTERSLGIELEALVTKGDAAWISIRKWRHKHLAHLDLDVALGRRATALQSVRTTDVDSALAALTDVIDGVQRWCSPDAHTVYDVLGRGGDARAIRYLLEEAKRD